MLLFVYGTLRPGEGAHARLGLARASRHMGPALARGCLYDLGTYPGMVDGEGVVRGDLLRLLDRRLLARLDRYEGYDPSGDGASEFLRRRIDLLSPRCSAEAYLYAGTLSGARRLRDGVWRG